MRQFLQLTAHEIRLHLRSKTFWLIGVLAVVTVLVPSVTVLLLEFAVISTITRDQRTGFSKILSSLPRDTTILVLARALAVFCLLLGLWPLMVIVVGVLPGVEPAEWLFNGKQFATLTLKYIITCATAVSFVFLAGLTTRNSLNLYLIAGAYWVIGVLVASNLWYFPAWSQLFLFGHGVMLPRAPSVAVGYFLQQNILPGFAAFQTAAAILFLVLAASHQMAKRGEPVLPSKLLISLFLVAITTASIAGFTVWRELDIRESEFRLALRETEQSQAVIAPVTSEATLEMEDYHLAIKLRTAAHYLEGTATLKLKLVDCSSDIVYFTLRNCFAVGDVIESGRGERLEWWRDGSRLAVRVPERYRPGDSLTLSIVYSGQVWEWFTGPSTRPNGPVNFVDTSFSLLRSGYAWYPIPGDHPLYTREYYLKPSWWWPDSTLWAKRALHSPVPFELTVDIDADSTAISNLEQTGVELLTGEYKQRYRFGSLLGRDVFLMAGPYHHEKRKFPGREDFVEVYCYPQHRINIDKVMNWLNTQYLFYEDMLQSERYANFSVSPAGKTCTVVEIPIMLIAGGEYYADVTLVNTVLINDADFQSPVQRLVTILGLGDAPIIRDDEAILRCWGQDGTASGYRDGNIAEGVGLYLYTLYTEKTRGRGFYEQVKQKLLAGDESDSGDFSLPKGPVVRDVFMILDAIRTSELGDPAIKKVMHQVYQVYVRKNNVDPADFATAVEAALAGADWPQERTDEVQRRLESITQRTNDPKSRKLERLLNVLVLGFY